MTDHHSDRTIIPASVVQISPNGKVAILNNNLGAILLADLSPNAPVPVSLPPHDEARISQSGSAVLMRSGKSIEVRRGNFTESKSFDLANSPILATAVSDDGQKVAFLYRTSTNTGKLVIWDLNAHKFLTEKEAPCFEYAFISANGDLSLLSLETASSTSSKRHHAIYHWNGEDLNEILPAYRDQWFRVAFSGQQVWLTLPEKVVCFDREEEIAAFPGNARTFTVFSPSGQFFALYSNEGSIDNTAEKIHFRVGQKTDMEVVADFTDRVQDFFTSGIALSDARSFTVITIDKAGKIVSEQVDGPLTKEK